MYLIYPNDLFPSSYIDTFQRISSLVKYLSHSYTIQYTGFFILYSYFVSQSNLQITNLKLTIKKGGVIVRRNQFTITGIYPNSARLIVPIVTTQACKVNFYWSGPNHDIKVYAPTITTLDNAVAAYTYASGTTSFPIDLNIPGTWYVVVFHNRFYIKDMKNITVRITT
jgi:hypothetical protein